MTADSRHPGARRGEGAPRWLALALGVAGAVLYLVRVYPGVGWYDSGELSGVAAVLGVAHPTGYPLYSLAGRLMVMVTAPFASPALGSNVLSALAAGATLGVLTLVAWQVQGLLRLGPLPRGVRLVACALPATALSSLPLFGEQAVVAEVYTIHTLMVALLLLVGLEAVRRSEQEAAFLPGETLPHPVRGVWGAAGWRLPALGAFVAGLSLGNHATTVLYVPATLFLLLWVLQQDGSALQPPVYTWRDRLRALLPLGVLMLVGLSLYLMVPIRASLEPLFNWGGADRARELLRLLTAAEARHRPAQYLPVTALNIWLKIAGGMGWWMLLLGALGWVGSVVRRPRLGIFAGLYLIFPMAFLLIGLDILEDALLPVHMFVALGLAVAGALVGERMVAVLGPRTGGTLAAVALALVVALGPGWRTVTGWEDLRSPEAGTPGEYARALAASVAGVPDPQGEVRGRVFAEDNTTAFLLWYQSMVEKIDPDLRGIYLLLAREEWYRRQLRGDLPSLNVRDFPRSVEEEPHQLAGRYLVLDNLDQGMPVFVHPVILPPEEIYGALVPQGLLLRVEKEGYVPTQADLQRHSEIIERWSPAFSEESHRLGPLSRDIWSSQHRLLGDAWAQLGLLQAAEVEYTAGVRINPDRPQTWVALASFYDAVGSWERAVEVWMGAVGSSGGDSELRLSLARALSRANRMSEADSVLALVSERKVDRATYLAVRSRIASDAGDLEAARVDLEQAAELAPESGEIQNDLGVLLLSLGEATAAKVAFQRAVELDPDLVEAWSNLGTFAVSEGKLEEAEGFLERAVEAGGSAPQIRQTLGVLRFRLGDREGAEEILRENMRAWPRDADTILTLAAVVEADGRIAEAIRLLETGRMAVPGDPRFATQLRRLRNPPPGTPPA